MNCSAPNWPVPSFANQAMRPSPPTSRSRSLSLSMSQAITLSMELREVATTLPEPNAVSGKPSPSESKRSGAPRQAGFAALTDTTPEETGVEVSTVGATKGKLASPAAMMLRNCESPGPPAYVVERPGLISVGHAPTTSKVTWPARKLWLANKRLLASSVQPPNVHHAPVCPPDVSELSHQLSGGWPPPAGGKPGRLLYVR